MTSTSIKPIDITLEPELHPLYPNPTQIEPLLSAHSGLAPAEKAELASHCLARACLFGDLSVLSYLLTDPQAQAYVDLSIQDEDGLGLVSLTIYGFGAESERDVEREECVRLLIAQGADINAADKGELLNLLHSPHY
jgi:Ankyrin repeat